MEPALIFVGHWYQMVFLSKNPPCAFNTFAKSLLFSGENGETQNTKNSDWWLHLHHGFYSQKVFNVWSLILYTRLENLTTAGSATNMQVWLRLASVTLQPLFFGELKEQHIQLGSLALKEVCWALPMFQWKELRKKHKKGVWMCLEDDFFSSNIWEIPGSSQ